MTRTILLPEKYRKTLVNLTSLVQEVNGILLYRPQGNYCPIETIYMTGIGNAGHVQASPNRVEIANAFFRKNDDYKFVKFHTHSKGTIRRFGATYAKNFSEGDIEGYDEQLRTDPDFVGMLVTPQTILLYGLDNPRLQIIKRYPVKADERIKRELREISDSLGHRTQPLIGTKKK